MICIFTVNLGNGSFSVIYYYYYYSGLIVIFKTRAAPVCFNTVTSSVQTLDYRDSCFSLWTGNKVCLFFNENRRAHTHSEEEDGVMKNTSSKK